MMRFENKEYRRRAHAYRASALIGAVALSITACGNQAPALLPTEGYTVLLPADLLPPEPFAEKALTPEPVAEALSGKGITFEFTDGNNSSAPGQYQQGILPLFPLALRAKADDGRELIKQGDAFWLSWNSGARKKLANVALYRGYEAVFGLPGPASFTLNDRDTRGLPRGESWKGQISEGGALDFMSATVPEGGASVGKLIMMTYHDGELFTGWGQWSAQIIKRYRRLPDGSLAYSGDQPISAMAMVEGPSGVWVKIGVAYQKYAWMRIDGKNREIIPERKNGPVGTTAYYENWDILANGAIELLPTNSGLIRPLSAPAAGGLLSADGSKLVFLQERPGRRLVETFSLEMGAHVLSVAARGNRASVWLGNGEVAVFSIDKKTGIAELGRLAIPDNSKNTWDGLREGLLIMTEAGAYLNLAGTSLHEIALDPKGKPSYLGPRTLSARRVNQIESLGDGLSVCEEPFGGQPVARYWNRNADGILSPSSFAEPEGLIMRHSKGDRIWLSPGSRKASGAQQLRQPGILFSVDSKRSAPADAASLEPVAIKGYDIGNIRSWLDFTEGVALALVDQASGKASLLAVDLDTGAVKGKAPWVEEAFDPTSECPFRYSGGMAVSTNSFRLWDLAGGTSFSQTFSSNGSNWKIMKYLGKAPLGLVLALEESTPGEGDSKPRRPIVRMTRGGPKRYGIEYVDAWYESIRSADEVGGILVGSRLRYQIPRLWAWNPTTTREYRSNVAIEEVSLAAGQVVVSSGRQEGSRPAPWIFLTYRLHEAVDN